MLIRADTPQDALDAVAEFVRLELVVCEGMTPSTVAAWSILTGRVWAFEEVATFVRDATIEPRTTT